MKSLEKILTREAPLIAIECWYNGLVKKPQYSLGIFLTENVFISENNTFECYRESQRLIALPKELAQWSKRHKEKIDLSYRNLKVAVNFFKKTKITEELSVNELLSYLERVKEYFANGFPGLFFSYWFSSWQEQSHKQGQRLFDDKIARTATQVRENEGDIFFNTGVNIIFKILQIIAQKYNWNFDLIKFITYKELIRSIKNKKLPQGALKMRLNTTFVYINDEIIFEPKINKRLKALGYEIKKERISAITEFKGIIANKGLARGKVKIIYCRSQLDKVKKGDILVAPMTSPWHIPAIKKASAIITDEGGITCHAAIISRELNKPCIISTRVATQALRDLDLVTVDANKGIVKILKN